MQSKPSTPLGALSDNPWSWIPTLYFAEGIPYFIVNIISVIMFTNMGLPNSIVALLTSLLYLPWVVKPLWSPFVDLIRTKRWWIVTMQALVSVSLIFAAIALPSQHTLANGAEARFFLLTLCIFYIMAFASSTHDIAADGYYMIALDEHRQSVFVGIRSTFYRLASIFGQGVLVVIAGVLENRLGNIPLAWKIMLIICSAMFALLTIWHSFVLPRPEIVLKEKKTAKEIFKGFGNAIASFTTKKGLGTAIIFMLLYRLPEAFLVKMMNPFLLDSIENGGLALSTQQVGLVYGTIGVAALTIGGIVGGLFAGKVGLRRSLLPMAAALALPCGAFVVLAISQTTNIIVIGSCVAVDQFGYGFGFTAYMLYLMHFSQGELKTSHYSICTAFMALSMMLPGLVAGYLEQWLGYVGFFWLVIVCCGVT
ncbi:MAG: MFS transporter, partial [Bacteroidales bacterium]|nr:MFS transporter [Bacteroidales bacterium]